MFMKLIFTKLAICLICNDLIHRTFINTSTIKLFDLKLLNYSSNHVLMDSTIDAEFKRLKRKNQMYDISFDDANLEDGKFWNWKINHL